MAARFFISGGLNSNWGDTSNWSTTSGGAGGSAVPLSTDDVTLDTNSPNCTINSSNRVCKSLTCTNYTNTITMSFAIIVSGAITLGSSMIIAGAAGLTANTGGVTLTSNGKTWPNAFTFSSTGTFTLADAWSVTGLVTNSASCTINGNSITCADSLAINANLAGSTTIILGGTGNWTGSGTVKCNLNINTAGTITMLSGTNRFDTGTFTYTAGTVVTTGNTLSISDSATLNIAGLTLNNFTIATTATKTISLASAIVITGAFTCITSTPTTQVTIQSTVGGNQRLFTLMAGGTQDIAHCNATDLDSRQGLTIFSYKATLSNTLNWHSIPATLPTISYSYVC